MFGGSAEPRRGGRSEYDMAQWPDDSRRTANVTRKNIPSVREEIASFVSHCLVNLHRHDAIFERRHEQRYAFPALISLTPTHRHTYDPLGEPLFVIGKQISVSGLGFFHAHPLAHSHYLVSIVNDISRETRVLWKARWCRFLGAQWYESGGLFLKIL
jgi:hypothetical protein